MEVIVLNVDNDWCYCPACVLELEQEVERLKNATQKMLCPSWMPETRACSEADDVKRIRRDNRSLREKNHRLLEALEKIYTGEGKVCSEYEICYHVACQSSHRSWAIAETALRDSRTIV